MDTVVETPPPLDEIQKKVRKPRKKRLKPALTPAQHMEKFNKIYRIAKYKKLIDNGILTEKEVLKRKKTILANFNASKVPIEIEPQYRLTHEQLCSDCYWNEECCPQYYKQPVLTDKKKLRKKQIEYLNSFDNIDNFSISE